MFASSTIHRIHIDTLLGVNVYTVRRHTPAPIQFDTLPYAFVYGGVYFLIRAGVVLVRNNYSTAVRFLLETPTKYKHKR